VSRRLLAALVAVAVVAVVTMVATAGWSTPSDDDGDVAVGGAFGEVVRPDDDATPIVVDTDLAGDDLVALAYLLRRPDVRVVAVTVAGTGLVGCDPGVDLVADLVHALGAGWLPVACGREDPARKWPVAWRTRAAEAPGLPRLDTTFQVASEPAPQLIAKLATSNDDLQVVSLGPLSNLADLAERWPRAYRRLAAIWSMAGAVDVQQSPDVAEWNAAADPAAMATVLAAPVPVTVVPDDPVPAGDPDALSAPVVGGIAVGNPVPKWWDTTTAAAFTEPTIATGETGHWEVDDTGRLTRTGRNGATTVITHIDPAGLEAALATAF
jgi:inosine-uridine nucleoside N-ribohydrolase